MNPFLYLFYQFLKLLVKLVFKIFYSKTTIINKEYLEIDNPSIVVSNHPNTLLDPLNVACRVNKVVHFLANAGLFQSKFGNWFFNTFYCIPIQRQKDVGGKRIQNDEAFARCDEFLTGGGCLYIAPEGTSVMERRLRPIKTGTARIALSAEDKNDFKLGLTIVPCGLTYNDPQHFRSEVLLNVGKPIKVANYQSVYKSDKQKAVKQLTNDLEQHMITLLLHPEDEDMDFVLKKMEELQQNDEPLPPEQHFMRTQHLAKALKKWKASQAKKYEQWKKKLVNYFYQLVQNKVDDYPISKGEIMSIGERWKKIFPLPVFFLLYMCGYINNFLPNYLPGLLTRKLKLYPGYDATVKTLSGLFIYPIFYGLQIWFVHWLFREWWVTLLYALSLYPIGLFALWFEKYFKRIMQRLRYDFLVQTKGSKMEEIKKMRNGVLSISDK